MTPDLPEMIRQRIANLREKLSTLPAGMQELVERQIENLQRQFGGGAAIPGMQEIAAQLVGGLAVDGQGPSGTGQERFHQYRGDLRAAVGVGGAVAFVTVHPEGLPTALYRLDADKLALQVDAMPCGGVALAVRDDVLYVAGTDHRLYTSAGTGTPQPLGEAFAGPIAAVLPVAKQKLAVLHGAHLAIVAAADGSVLQTLDLPEPGTCLAADRTGTWLAVGTNKGTVAVFDGQDRDEFEPAEAERLHDGAVTALLFEPDDLRFFSAGADNKLLSTFARGRLEPEDKGRGNTHEDLVTAMLFVPGDRFITGSKDGTLKSWPRVGGVKPTTLKEGCGKVVALATVTVYNQLHVAACCDDNSIRLFKVEADGRFGEEPGPRVYGATDWVKNELAQQHDPRRREKALKTLAEWKDAASIDLLGERLDKESDHPLRLAAVQLLAASDHPRVGKILEKAIGHADGKVRVQAFQGLYKPLKPDFGPIDLALKAGHADVGTIAVRALEPLAKTDDQALTRLTDALNANTWDVRKQALASLETVFEKASPRASLTALTAKHGDVRAFALTRVFERGLLADPAVQSAIRRRLEDEDAGVRKVAFLLSVVAQTLLAAVLRAADGELNRQLNELEKADKPDRPAPGVPANAKSKLTPADYDVLLQATASRALDTCLRGARGLAVLRDPRAFGLLLQLSREQDASARVEVCRALAALDDARTVDRLKSMLRDPDASVRDAAFTALARILAADPLAVADTSSHAPEEDVRRRGLQVLVEAVKKDAPQSPADRGWELLVRALNDGAAGVRGEAFKAALNLKVAGGGPDTLRFALGSIHADVRREALTEVTAQEKEAWATPLLYEFFNDPDPGLRAEAFGFATRKNKEVAVLETALASRYPDARKLAVEALVKKHSRAAQQVLLRAAADPDRDVRLPSVEALVGDDARGPLAEAMASPLPDVRVRAAAALARHGDPAALPPLRELATAPQPPHRERVADWLDTARLALAGLGELGDPAALPDVARLVDSPHAPLRGAAAAALVWVARSDTAVSLRAALRHPDPHVRAHAALGLAFLGDRTAVPTLTALTDAEQFAATVVLRATGSGPAAYLDHETESLRDRALLAMLLLELVGTDGQPEMCIACLSARGPRYRLVGAQAIETFADPAGFREFVAKEVNDRGEDAAWKVAPEVVDDFAALLAFAPPQTVARTSLLLRHFDEKDQAAWNQAWAVHASRFAAEIASAKAAAKKAGVPVASKLAAAELRELAFGTYVGLVREQGASGGNQAIGKVRQTALARIFAIASKDAAYARAAQPVLAQAMGDPIQPVRTQAFEHLQSLGTDRTRLGEEALEAGYTDLGVKGLELLAGDRATTAGAAVLERVMLARTDDLATEAAKLLRDRAGTATTASKALDAVHEPLRLQAVAWLAAEYDTSADAQIFLRLAVDSRYRRVREAAAFELAGKKDAAAFDALAKMLPDPAFARRQKQIIDAFHKIGDRRAAAVFLDRVENDPAGTADADALVKAAADYRDPATADRLLGLADRKKEWQPLAFRAARTLSGHDQPIRDPEGESADRKWESEQYPRRDAVLARLMERAFAAGNTDFLLELMPAARWSRGPDVDPVLVVLVANPNAELRDAAVQAAGWRLRKRNAPADPLLKAVRHKNPVTQFHAAEGLARGKRPEGLGVLLSGIEYLDDVALRQRAVTALGELGDPRAVDKLLQLAGEDGHPLQDAAAEAVGHLKRSPQADAIFRLLERLAKGTGGVARRALVGLRYFDTPGGWDVVRGKLAANSRPFPHDTTRPVAAEQLGYNDDPATRDLLLKVVRTEGFHLLTGPAFVGARRLFGTDSLEPHYHVIQNQNARPALAGENSFDVVMTAVAERGDALRIMEIFPSCPVAVQGPLEAALLARPNPPVKEAVAALTHADEGTVRLATRLLGRISDPTDSVRKAVAAALARWWEAWQQRRTNLTREAKSRESLDRATPVVESLLFTAARVGVPAATLADVAKARPDDPLARGIRLEAVRCLVMGKPSAATLGLLEGFTTGTDAEVRVLAADLLARIDPKRAAALAEKLLSDRPAFNRLVEAGAVPAAKVAAAAGQAHYQPVVLPVLIAAKDIPPLAVVAKDRKAAEAVRLGAIEGLGVMADEAAERVLVEVGTTTDDDKDVRKAAWRALRRSKRARKKTTA